LISRVEIEAALHVMRGVFTDLEPPSAKFLVDRTNGRAYGTTCHPSVCLSSVTLCIVAVWPQFASLQRTFIGFESCVYAVKNNLTIRNLKKESRSINFNYSSKNSCPSF